ncbi:MAG: biopolymer transporter ExbD [Bdellovibrionaceae bacterium]|nr:biopolymer transporter ExbD [Pseudobdellovibrionaceae bacterium]
MDIQSHIRSNNINGELNIVPFIDLLSVLIIFLLFTSVWSQLSMIELGSSIHGKQTESNAKNIKNKSSLSLSVLKKGYLLRFSGKSIFISKKNGEYDSVRLKSLLKNYKKKFPKQVTVAISMPNQLEYRFLVEAMDYLLSENLSNLTISAEAF